MNYFFVDAETDGLYGTFLSIAVAVSDKNGILLDRFYGRIDIDRDQLQSEWVKRNVFDSLSNAEKVYASEYELLEAVWDLWMKHRETAYAVADVMHPVESRLFTECVRHDEKNREFLGPFPLLDLSTLLMTRGVDWNADRNELSGMALTRHDAMDDVLMLKENWFRHMG